MFSCSLMRYGFDAQDSKDGEQETRICTWDVSSFNGIPKGRFFEDCSIVKWRAARQDKKEDWASKWFCALPQAQGFGSEKKGMEHFRGHIAILLL